MRTTRGADAPPSSFSQIPRGAGALSFSQIPCGADVERYKLSYLDWGKCDDKNDWDALTNGDID